MGKEIDVLAATSTKAEATSDSALEVITALKDANSKSMIQTWQLSAIVN
jgi:hypothetical protein